MQGDTVQEPGDGGAGAQTPGEGTGDAAPRTAGGASDFDRRMLLAVGHLLIGAATLALWAAADAWQSVTGLFAGAVLSVLLAVPAGVVFSTLVHEWCHFLGARLAGASYRVPARFGLFVFDFDYRANGVERFRLMSYGGQAGSVLAVLLLWLALPLDTAGRAMLLSAAIGSGVFGALIEWPVLARVGAGAEPLAALGEIDKALLYRSAATGSAVTLGLWLLLS
jgi:hypothetical protein